MDVANSTKSKRGRQPLQRFYSVHDLAEMFDVDVRTIYRWRANGNLRVYKIGGVLRVSEEDFQDLLEKSRA